MTKKALFLSGGWEGHEPQETSEFISSELQQFKIQSEIVNELDALGDKNFLKNFNLQLIISSYLDKSCSVHLKSLLYISSHLISVGKR